MKSLYLSVIAIGMIAISSCKKIDPLENNKLVRPLTSSSDTDVYAAGYETIPQSFNFTTPVYWKNGVLNKLPELISGVATDIALQNSDVLIAGTEVFDSQNLATQAVYWRNGIKTVLAQNAMTTRIFVDSSGTNFYIAGSIGQMACYWKNGIIHQLHCSGSADDTEQANDIVVKGNDVYLAGMVQSVSSGKQYPLYWKNDQLQVLSETNTDADAHGIAINGSDVYISGGDGSGATVWKNGVAADLPGGASAQRLAFAGNDMYVAGNNNADGEGVYWKNDVMTALSNSAYAAQAVICMAVLGNSVYIGGSVSPTAGPGAFIPAYWKNGALTRLPYDSGGLVQGITLALHH